MWYTLPLVVISLSFLSAQPLFGPLGLSPYQYQAPIGQAYPGQTTYPGQVGYAGQTYPAGAQTYPGQIGYPYGLVPPTQEPSLFDRFVAIGTDAIHSLTKRNTGTTTDTTIATNTGAGTIPSTTTTINSAGTPPYTTSTATLTPTRSPLEIGNEVLQSMFGMTIPTQPAPISTNIIAPAAASTITTAQVVPTSTVNTAATSTPNLDVANNNPITIPLATYTTSPSTSTSTRRKLRSRIIEPTEVVSP